MKKYFGIKIALVACAAVASSTGYAFGRDDVQSFKFREDGKLDVECKYGETEKGISLKDYYLGNVCEAYSGLAKVKLMGMRAGGGCGVYSFSMKQNILGSTFRIRDLSTGDSQTGDQTALCTFFSKFSVPKGYKFGIKAMDINLESVGLKESDEVLVNLSGGMREKLEAEEVFKGNLKKVSSFVLSDYFYTGCSSEDRKAFEINFNWTIGPRDDEATIDGKSKITKIIIKDARLVRCDQEESDQ